MQIVIIAVILIIVIILIFRSNKKSPDNIKMPTSQKSDLKKIAIGALAVGGLIGLAIAKKNQQDKNTEDSNKFSVNKKNKINHDNDVSITEKINSKHVVEESGNRKKEKPIEPIRNNSGSIIEDPANIGDNFQSPERIDDLCHVWREGAIVKAGLVDHCIVLKRIDEPLHFYLETPTGEHITYFPYEDNGNR